ncbi:MAG: glycosyltransferase [Methylococcaceae bacterium]|nr:glycosyltransferase [Methylococcaceae bacterium]
MTGKIKKNLLILGVYPESAGYPNIKYRLEDLAKLADFAVVILHKAIWQNNISNQKIPQLLTTGWRFVAAHGIILIQYLKHPHKELIYIPYPAVFISCLLSILPQRYRPKRLILDAFISLYDTICIDRGYFSTGHIVAKLLFHIERRAYQNSSAVIVDTEQNALYLSELFNLPQQLFVAIPLSTNEQHLPAPAYPKPSPNKIFQVLFIGTLIPLQGVEVIVGAIKLLAQQTNVVFKIIGDGQMAPLIAEVIATNPNNLIWIKEWQEQTHLLAAIQNADICLGIFGSTAKTQRVCPLKIYHYAACGRAIITAKTDWMHANTQNHLTPPFILIPPGSAEVLAAAIKNLITQPEQIKHYAQAAQQFYTQSLSNQHALKQLLPLLLNVN